MRLPFGRPVGRRSVFVAWIVNPLPFLDSVADGGVFEDAILDPREITVSFEVVRASATGIALFLSRIEGGCFYRPDMIPRIVHPKKRRIAGAQPIKIDRILVVGKHFIAEIPLNGRIRRKAQIEGPLFAFDDAYARHAAGEDAFGAVSLLIFLNEPKRLAGRKLLKMLP